MRKKYLKKYPDKIIYLKKENGGQGSARNLGIEKCRIEDMKASVIGFYRKGRKKLDRTDSKKWKIYSALWMHLFPIRRYLLAAYRRIWIPILGPM